MKVLWNEEAWIGMLIVDCYELESYPEEDEIEDYQVALQKQEVLIRHPNIKRKYHDICNRCHSIK